MSFRTRFLLLAILLLLLLAVPMAMRLPFQGSVAGVITDESGPVPGAVIQSKDLVSGDARRTMSDEQGRYILERMDPGKYSLWVQAEGHTSVWVARLVVEAGQTIHRDVQLQRERPTHGS